MPNIQLMQGLKRKASTGRSRELEQRKSLAEMGELGLDYLIQLER